MYNSMFYNTFQIGSTEEGRMKQMDNLKWKKIIIKDKFHTENGTIHNIQRIYIALCNTENRGIPDLPILRFPE